LRAGLSLDVGGRDIAEKLLADVPISSEWSLRLAGAPRTALRLEELRSLTWRQRVAALVRWVLPAPAVLRMRDPGARGGPLQLIGAYLRRLNQGVTSLPPSVRAIADSRHRKSSPHMPE